MTKFKKSLLIFGMLAVIVGAALGTFIVLSLMGSLKAELIALEITVDDAAQEYDGNPLKATSYKLIDGELIDGHRIIVNYTGEQTDVGTNVSGADVKIVDEKDFDVTDEYKIKVNSGILSVSPSSVIVSLSSQDVIYDGNSVDIEGKYSVTGGALVKGHSVSLKIKDEWFESAGKIVAGQTLDFDDVDLLIVDSNGRDVSSNYLSALKMGTVNIVKRPLVISPVNAEKIYDGKPLVCSAYNIETGSLASGHYIANCQYVQEDGNVINLVNANPSEPLKVKINSVIICDLNGDDVTENYNMTTGYGYLTVKKAPLVVSWGDVETEYGTPVSESDIDCSLSVDDVDLEFKDPDYLSQLIDCKSAIGMSTYTVSAENFDIVGESGKLTGNFDISVVAGNLKITRREVELNTNGTLEKTYDGNFVFPAGENLSFDKDLIEGHRFESVTCASVSGLKAGDEKETQIISFALTDEQGIDAIGFYNITNLNTVTVKVKFTAKDLNCETESYEKVYDGTPLDGGEVKCDQLVTGDKLEYKTVSIINVETKDNKPELEIYNSNNEKVTEFYKIEWKSGKLTVKPKPVTVYIDKEIEYNENLGKGTDKALWEFVECDEADKNLFQVDYKKTDGGFKCGNSYTVNSFSCREKSNDKNYAITEGNKDFVVIKRKHYANIVAGASKNYDGTPIKREDLTEALIPESERKKYVDYTCASSNLVGKVDAREYDAEIIYEKADSTEQLIVRGKYTINKIKVTVSLKEEGVITTTYNGLPYKPSANELTLSNENFKIKDFTLTEDLVEPKEYTLSFNSVDIVTKTGDPVNAGNVEISNMDTAIKVKVNQRQLGVSLTPVTIISFYAMEDLSGLVNISNLADGDIVTSVTAINSTKKSNITIADDGVTMQYTTAGAITIMRGDKDVTSYYDIPPVVEGVLILVAN